MNEKEQIIKSFLKLWNKKNLRFGQLLYYVNDGKDPFFLENKDLLKKLIKKIKED